MQLALFIKRQASLGIKLENMQGSGHSCDVADKDTTTVGPILCQARYMLQETLEEVLKMPLEYPSNLRKKWLLFFFKKKTLYTFFDKSNELPL